MTHPLSKGWNSLTIEDLPRRKEKPEECPACGVYGFHRSECPTRKPQRAQRQETRRP